jgi:hypothetical protein
MRGVNEMGRRFWFEDGGEHDSPRLQRQDLHLPADKFNLSSKSYLPISEEALVAQPTR